MTVTTKKPTYMFEKREADEQDEFDDKRYGALNARIAAALREAGFAYPNLVSYSVYEDLDEVPIRGLVRFVRKCPRSFGDGTDFVSPVLKNPSWLRIAMVCAAMIDITGDHHHVFLVGVDEVARDGGVVTAEFSMES